CARSDDYDPYYFDYW
nr:immunoglobulin heavy chain junction region [Mus musculus]NSM07389.1 immunoglobulin heavy chain junction region [Mus musculus]NSM09432.1 immunoglobulin heavy chain junction region [Mus musculus]